VTQEFAFGLLAAVFRAISGRVTVGGYFFRAGRFGELLDACSVFHVAFLLHLLWRDCYFLVTVLAVNQGLDSVELVLCWRQKLFVLRAAGLQQGQRL